MTRLNVDRLKEYSKRSLSGQVKELTREEEIYVWVDHNYKLTVEKFSSLIKKIYKSNADEMLPNLLIYREKKLKEVRKEEKVIMQAADVYYELDQEVTYPTKEETIKFKKYGFYPQHIQKIVNE